MTSSIEDVSEANVSGLVLSVPRCSGKPYLQPATLTAIFNIYTKATEPTCPTVEQVVDPDGLPPGWQRVESRSRKGEFSYLNMSNGKRQAVLPKDPVPGYSYPVNVTLAKIGSPEQVEAHLAFSKFCDNILPSVTANSAVSLESLSAAFLRSHMSAMRFMFLNTVHE